MTWGKLAAEAIVQLSSTLGLGVRRSVFDALMFVKKSFSAGFGKPCMGLVALAFMACAAPLLRFTLFQWQGRRGLRGPVPRGKGPAAALCTPRSGPCPEPPNEPGRLAR